MNPDLLHKILFKQLASGHDVTISVTGESMNPTLWEGDTVTVQKADSYAVGDILVFLYKGELLIHRLLKIENNRFFCKGDNSFRLEDMPIEAIGGKVIRQNGKNLPPFSQALITLSYQVNRCFRKNGYDMDKTKKSGIFRFYHQILWNVEDKTMNYQKNNNMDYIPTDETSLAVFDPESGNTHFFDETGVDILNCLEHPCDLTILVSKLCEIYDAPPAMIREDVEEFLAELVAKKVVIIK
ncbi:MAG: HPr-rel-A system PqqD family peptide chaperone [Clostridia bacterium]|nr:HPr-rel-A system PqqD family peptide chaperone [Clostridia bacterium]